MEATIKIDGLNTEVKAIEDTKKLCEKNTEIRLPTAGKKLKQFLELPLYPLVVS